MSTSSNNSASNGVPEAQLIIDLTQTDLPKDTSVYIYVVGLVTYTDSNNNTVDDFYFLDNNFMPQLMTTAANVIPAFSFPGQNNLSPAAQQAITPGYPLAWADWSIPVKVGSNQILCLGNINTTNIPNLGTGVSAFSGRMYVSVGVPKLPFTVQESASGQISYAAPVYGNGSGITGSLSLYDWIEFSYDSLGNFDGNTTQVNQFGFPLMLTGTPLGNAPYPTQGVLNTARNTILTDIASGNPGLGGSAAMVPVPAAATIAYPPNTNYLRAISPVTISGAGTSLNTYFDAVIPVAYTAWQTTPLVTTDPSTGSYTGVVFPILADKVTIATPTNYTTGSLAFYEGSFATMAELAAAIAASPDFEPSFCLTGSSNLITSNDIWQCAGSIASGSAAQKNVGKMIGAAFNRGVIVNPKNVVITTLNDGTCSGLVGNFYPAGGTFNVWSQSFHSYSANTLAYGFPYDDVCDQNSSIPPSGDTLVASFIRIALGKFYS
jgi:hypothetical protein